MKMNMNTPSQMALDAFLRFHDDYPNVSPKESLPAIRSILKRFGLVSVEELIVAAKKKRDALEAEIENYAECAVMNNEAVETPMGAVEQLMLTVLVGNCDGPPLTQEQRAFFSSMPFKYDKKRDEFFIGNARGQRLSVAAR